MIGRSRCLYLLAVLGCAHNPRPWPVPPPDWQDAEDRRYDALVIIVTARGAVATGTVISSSEHGTYVLTAAHIVSDNDGYQDLDSEPTVMVPSRGHLKEPSADYVTYAAQITATTFPSRPAGETKARVDAWSGEDDVAVLRLVTSERFHFVPVWSGDGEPWRLGGAIGVGFAATGYPRKQDATVSETLIELRGGRCVVGLGDSGGPVFQGDRVIGVFTLLLGGRFPVGVGPQPLLAFLRRQPETSFLLHAKK